MLVKVVDVRVWILKLGPKRGNRLSLGTVDPEPEQSPFIDNNP